MSRYQISNGLKFQLNFICLGLAPHDITIIMWFWLVVVREKSTHRGWGGGSYVICHSLGGGNN